MPQSQLDNVVTHWNKLVENFETSSLDFYGSVEEALGRRKIPGLKTTHVDWQEGGVLSPRREYLRITGGRHSFDICAAPFGTGFFFSSWLTQRKARWVLFFFLAIIVLTDVIARVLSRLLAGAFVGFVGGTDDPQALFELGILQNHWIFTPLALLVLLWLIAMAARMGHAGPERAVLRIPLLGWFYERVFAPETYYRIDTMLMFQSAVHSAMLEVIDGLTSEKGLRGLTDDERKPVFHKLM